jgi:hypothetical protein
MIINFLIINVEVQLNIYCKFNDNF